jgi:transcriptional regulator with XRE-family HTH domain
MVRNEVMYQRALALRQRGYTLAEIASACSISKATASNWLKNNDFSSTVTVRNKRRAGLENAKRLHLINKTKRSERTRRYQEVERSAAVEYRHYKRDPLFTAGLMVYAACGDLQTDHVLRVSSGQMNLHAVFIAFAVSFLGISRTQIKCWLLLSPTADEVMCMKRWCRGLKISPAQFHKNQFRTSSGAKSSLQFGVGTTIIGSTLLKRKMKVWVTLVQKELGS